MSTSTSTSTIAGGTVRRLGRALTAVAGVLLLIGASTVGLDDWADAQLDGVAVHGSPSWETAVD